MSLPAFRKVKMEGDNINEKIKLQNLKKAVDELIVPLSVFNPSVTITTSNWVKVQMVGHSVAMEYAIEKFEEHIDKGVTKVANHGFTDLFFELDV